MENPTDKPSLPVTIDESSRREPLQRLGEIMDRIGAEFQARGFKPEDILEAIPDFPLELLRD